VFQPPLEDFGATDEAVPLIASISLPEQLPSFDESTSEAAGHIMQCVSLLRNRADHYIFAL